MGACPIRLKKPAASSDHKAALNPILSSNTPPIYPPPTHSIQPFPTLKTCLLLYEPCSTMTKRKRKSGAHLDAETSSPSGAKRARQATDSGSVVAAQSVSYGRVDPTYGQRSAIPGLDDDDDYGHEGTGQDREGGGEGDDEVEYGVDVEALRYLRSVRYACRSLSCPPPSPLSPSPFPRVSCVRERSCCVWG